MWQTSADACNFCADSTGSTCYSLRASVDKSTITAEHLPVMQIKSPHRDHCCKGQGLVVLNSSSCSLAAGICRGSTMPREAPPPAAAGAHRSCPRCSGLCCSRTYRSLTAPCEASSPLEPRAHRSSSAPCGLRWWSRIRAPILLPSTKRS